MTRRYLVTSDWNWRNQVVLLMANIMEVDPAAYIYLATSSDDLESYVRDKFGKSCIETMHIEYRDFEFHADVPIIYGDPNPLVMRILAIDELAARGVDKVLYLDADIVLRPSLLDIWNVDLQGRTIGAVRDIGPASNSMYAADSAYMNVYKDPFATFNSGLMLVDLEQVRRKYPEGLTPDRYGFKEFPLPDQEYLFRKLKEDVTLLSSRYNYFGDPRSMAANHINYSLLMLFKAVKGDVSVIHFAGGLKPWSKLKVPLHIEAVAHRVISMPYFMYRDKCHQYAELLEPEFLSAVDEFYLKVGVISHKCLDCILEAKKEA